MTYNNCFVLGGKSKTPEGKTLKIPMFIDAYGNPKKLYGGKKGELAQFYSLPYEQAFQTLNTYLQGEKRIKGDDSLRVSLYLDNAKYGDLHIFVIDFDKINGEVDTESDFFKDAQRLADKITRSQGGGYHMFYGIDRATATSLFDGINLLTAKGTTSFVNKTGCVTLDGKNKVDMFCDALHFMYEWELWDNTVGLADRTQELYELIKANFSLKRPMEVDADIDEFEDADGEILLEGYSEGMLLDKMTEQQREVFANLKTLSADCSRSEWFSIGINIYHVFGDELGGYVFLWWSKHGHSYQPQGCARTWNNIQRKGPKTTLNNSLWAQIMGFERNVFDLAEKEAREREQAEALARVGERVRAEREAAQQVPLDVENTHSTSAAQPFSGNGRQFQFGDLTARLDKQKPGHFLLPDGDTEKSVTAYAVLERLAGADFKSDKIKMTPLNDKLQVFPYSERYRAVCYFRHQYKVPLPLENAAVIVDFIKTALSCSENVELSQNWRACLDVTGDEELAAALLVRYGWAPNFRKELPREENAFYKVSCENGTRHYEIVEDDISLRFEAIQRESLVNLSVPIIIQNAQMTQKEKYKKLQAIFQPRLWWRDNIRMGLTADALGECNRRIGNYIDALLDFNVLDEVELADHIGNVEIDKSNPGFVWGAPRSFDVSMGDFTFAEYQNNITAKRNQENAAALGAARSKAAAERNFASVTGDEWTTAELARQGINKDKLARLVKNGLIEKTSRSHYRRSSC